MVLVNGTEYVVSKKLGEGAYGVVNLAKKKGSNEEVVLKTVTILEDADYIKRRISDARRECIILKQLNRVNHPNLIRYIDDGFVTEKGKYIFYLVIERAKGKMLREVMMQCKFAKSTLKYKLHIMKQIAAGIASLHHLGIVHRDIKAENIMVHTQGKKTIVKVIDFGFASFYYPYKDNDKKKYRKWIEKFPYRWIASDNFWKGTPTYIAPELWKRNIDPWGTYVLCKSDVFALGCLFYRMLDKDNRCPWSCIPRTPEERLKLRDDILGTSFDSSRQEETIRNISDRKDLNLLINYMISINPDERPSMNQVLHSLTKIYDSL